MTPEERKIYSKAYYEKNKDKLNQGSRDYYSSHKEKLSQYYKEYSVTYYQENKDKRLAYQRAYYKLNGSKYYEENKDAILKKKKELYHAYTNIKSACQAKTNNIIKNIEKEKEKAEAFKATLCH
jgi:hypothetical protein